MEMDIDSYGKASTIAPYMYIYIIAFSYILHDLYIIFSSNYTLFIYYNKLVPALCVSLSSGWGLMYILLIM